MTNADVCCPLTIRFINGGDNKKKAVETAVEQLF